MSVVKDIYIANELDGASEQEKYNVLSELYFEKYGVTFENFVVTGTPLMKKARIMIEAVFNGARKAPITNKDLDISKPKDALF
mgnify:CR=1 FL=1